MNKNVLQKLIHEIAVWLFISVFMLSNSAAAQHKVYGSTSFGNAFEQLCINYSNSTLTNDNNNKTHSDYVQNCDACFSHNSIADTGFKPFNLILHQFAELYHLDQTPQYKAKKAAILPPLRGPPIFI